MKVSIVIPTKNRSEVLKRSLGSAVNQTYPADEIIVADNNSTDNTRKIIESFNNNRIIHLHTNEDITITENWIRGINAASGEWIKIIYDDDWIENNFLEKTISYIDKDKVMIHTGGIIHVLMTKHSDNMPPQTINKELLTCTSEVDHKMPPHVLLAQGMLQVSPVGALIKKSALDYAISIMPMLDKTCFDSGIGPDIVLLYADALQKRNSWIHIPDILAHYDGRFGSLSIKTVTENPDFLHYCYAKSFHLLDKLWLDYVSDQIKSNKKILRMFPTNFLDPTSTIIYSSRFKELHK
jgi:glycosyltransferase involved in cell wall biosynthesis